MSNFENSYDNFMSHFDSAVAKSGREKNQINLIAVSKTQPIEKIIDVYQKGQRHFGENYVQEALEKQEQLADLKINWHFIGGLQKNKAKLVVGNFDLIHSVDDLELAKKISQCAINKGIEQKCLVQINIGGELSKGGFEVQDILKQMELLLNLPNIHWQGIMVMPPITEDENQARRYLKQTREIFEQVRANLNDNQKKQWIHLSMGTSHDFVWAIEEGATMIRIGTLIFGERQRNKNVRNT